MHTCEWLCHPAGAAAPRSVACGPQAHAGCKRPARPTAGGEDFSVSAGTAKHVHGHP